MPFILPSAQELVWACTPMADSFTTGASGRRSHSDSEESEGYLRRLLSVSYTLREGLASGPSILGRYGKEAKELADVPEVWELEADYLAQAISNYILMYSPQKIILWGGVMHQEKLFAMIRENVKEMLHGYIYHPMISEHMDDYIVAPGLGENPGVLGSMKLGMLEWEKEEIIWKRI